MISGNLDKLDFKAQSFSKGLQEALLFLKGMDFSKLENKKYSVGKHDIEDVFMTVSEYNTKLIQEKNAEQHRKFIDIHAVVKGEEVIGIGAEDAQNKVVEEYSEEKDRALFTCVNNEEFFILKPGRYAICFPEDIHRPGCDSAGESFVKKIVVKIKKPE
jgi:YhcH/YjgK/YiaL family protein